MIYYNKARKLWIEIRIWDSGYDTAKHFVGDKSIRAYLLGEDKPHYPVPALLDNDPRHYDPQTLLSNYISDILSGKEYKFP